MRNKDIKFKDDYLTCSCGGSEFEVAILNGGLQFYCQKCSSHNVIEIKKLKENLKRL